MYEVEVFWLWGRLCDRRGRILSRKVSCTGDNGTGISMMAPRVEILGKMKAFTSD